MNKSLEKWFAPPPILIIEFIFMIHLRIIKCVFLLSCAKYILIQVYLILCMLISTILSLSNSSIF